MVDLETTIAAVTVYPDRARVTRSGTTTLAAGEHHLRVSPLPLELLRDSIRVAGRGEVTVLGVDIVTERQPEAGDEEIAALTARRDEVDTALAELADADKAADARVEFLQRLVHKSAGALAKASDERVQAFGDSLEAQYATVHAGRRDRARLRQDKIREKNALERRLADLGRKNRPDIRSAIITVDAAQPAAVELELSYVVPGAKWSSSYDLRIDDKGLNLRWFGLVSQQTGEDWPECRLELSTARPAVALDVPELDPWYLSTTPPEPKRSVRRRASMDHGGENPFAVAASAPAGAPPLPPAAPVREAVSTVEHGATAATYTPRRPVAIASDGSEHRTLLTAVDLEADLDHVTAPLRSPEAILRATARNTSEHTLPRGRASLFNHSEYVGATLLDIWAPGEERELALGVDDRIRVERELQRRNASKSTLGSTHRTEWEYTITVANHGARPTTVTVLDRLPVARDTAVTVKETVLKPPPAERDELGILTWKQDLAPQAATTITLGYRVEAPKGVTIFGLPD
ncbi:mucoidy inhibitor MuiA family protein [Nocardia yunnanensis]|uniref:Mucoidy inhibitor MuiA family protein n=1 Tax=Nocardia yunnanensis TaxID=2382165 RepID=A0A386ZIC0_9NOCA|nr:mucoidy inhibitor MuiA family protein [Nocardia yunnanensis]AYF77298.1 mucoidy inhibitor MuiA family protein [Nocardia yunnanensis]